MDNAVKQNTNSYNDYKAYPENERVELIEGQVYAMSPSPSRAHQKIITEVVTIINNHIKSNKGDCEVYPAPFDVILNENNDMDSSKNVVQPDISVICDKNKLNDKGCLGAPDLIIEVVSPYNPTNDYIRKLSLYNQFKVREYWIVNPMNESILVYQLDDTNAYAAPKTYSFKDKIIVCIFGDLFIDFGGISIE